MTMTVVITRDVPDRFRGFLASVMLEVAPGVYTAPRMSHRVRDQVWSVLKEWHASLMQGGVLMTWPDRHAVGGQVLRYLGWSPRELVEVDGVFLSRVLHPDVTTEDDISV